MSKEIEKYLVWGCRAFSLALLIMFIGRIAFPNGNHDDIARMIIVIASIGATKTN